VMTRQVVEIPETLKSCRIVGKVNFMEDFVLSSDPDPEVTELYGEDNPDISFLPINMYEIYPNLKSISFSRCDIWKFSNTTFANLTSIIRIALNNNDIDWIEDGIFDDLVNLKYLYLDNNRIGVIEANAFRPLKSLRKLTLSGNRCINENFGAKDVPEVFDEAPQICKDYFGWVDCLAGLERIKTYNEFLERILDEDVGRCGLINLKNKK
jgi:hypothetical protein